MPAGRFTSGMRAQGLSGHIQSPGAHGRGPRDFVYEAGDGLLHLGLRVDCGVY